MDPATYLQIITDYKKEASTLDEIRDFIMTRKWIQNLGNYFSSLKCVIFLKNIWSNETQENKSEEELIK